MRIGKITISLASFIFVASCGHTPTPKTTYGEKTMTEKQQVIAAVERMTAAFHAGNIEGVMASYEEQATIVFEPGVPVTERSAQREWFLQAFTLKPVFTYQSGHEVFVNGDTAVHIAPWLMTGTAPDGTKVEQGGLSIAVLHKQVDGRWLIGIDDPHGQHLLNP